MDEAVVVHSQVRSWLRCSVLDSHISKYIAYLRERRYTKRTEHSYVYDVAHFAHWMNVERTLLSSLDEEVVAAFLEDHLRSCSCPYPVRRSVHENRAALRRLLEALRAGGVIGQRPLGQDPTSSELARFEHHMEYVCGLADFVLNRQGKHSAGTVRVVGGALRCYLRFRALTGDDVQGLLDAVPSAAHWRLAALPEVLTEAEVQRLLGSFQQLARSPKRAYAMVRCLTDLGLRASEVIGLRLDDINWREGTIHLPTGKIRRGSVLPLTVETGQAIADYLRTERPLTVSRSVFVRHVAPHDKRVGPGVVRRAVREAYQRCGWTHSRVHVLRHSMASALLRHGTPLKEIADLLRHRSLDTSMIYAKVDLSRLTAVALPWPGRQL
jgi:integrase/recombinase XerD